MGALRRCADTSRRHSRLERMLRNPVPVTGLVPAFLPAEGCLTIAPPSPGSELHRHRDPGLRPHPDPALRSGPARRRGPGGRSPKRARPILTMVEPADTATSRSSVMPMERSRSPRSSASRATDSKVTAALERSGAATVMRPLTSSPSPRRFATRPGTSADGQPFRPGRPVVSTSTMTAAPGATRDPISLRLASNGLPDPDEGASEATLLRLDRPEEVPSGPRPGWASSPDCSPCVPAAPWPTSSDT